MIQLFANNDALVVEYGGEKSAKELATPFHRIFLKGVLGGEKIGKEAWEIPWGQKKEATLVNLLKHLDKYSFEYEIDSGCQQVLQNLADRNEEYQRKLDSAQAAKHEITDEDIEEIQGRLGDEFVRTLTKPQVQAVKHLLAINNGANFSVPGSGKTSILLAYFHLLRRSKKKLGLLVAGPISSFQPWQDEFKKCFGRKAIVERVSGKTKAQRDDLYLFADKFEMLLVSYPTLARDVEEVIQVLSRRPYLLVLDESHYIKRPIGGKQADAVLSLANFAYRRVILTGTPMPNGFADLWSQITFLWPDQQPLGSVRKYLQQIRTSKAEQTLSRVKGLIDPFFFRVTKQQLGLPEPKFVIISCKLKPLQERIYKGVAERYLSRIDEAPGDRDSLREWRRARTIRLLQVAVNPVLLRKRTEEFRLPPYRIGDETLKTLLSKYGEYETPKKIEQACAIAREVCELGGKVIIWSTFIHNLTMLEHLLEDLGAVTIHGSVPYGDLEDDEWTREKLISKFKNDTSTQVLIANPAACAESISLHMVCHTAIYLDRSFNCAHYLQSLDRIHRLGLKAEDSTTYYILVSANTIDEVVHDRLIEKMRRLRDVVEGDLPGEVSGYWGDDLGSEEERDFDLVEEHLKLIGP